MQFRIILYRFSFFPQDKKCTNWSLLFETFPTVSFQQDKNSKLYNMNLIYFKKSYYKIKVFFISILNNIVYICIHN